MRAWLLKLLGLVDAAAEAQKARDACVMAQRAASLALAYAESARGDAESVRTGMPPVARGRRADRDFIDDDIPTDPYPR